MNIAASTSAISDRTEQRVWRQTSLLVSVLLSTTLVASCATDDPNRRAKQGAVIGAVAGAVIGHQIDDDKGSILGAAIGAIAGGSAGQYQDRQQRELEAALEKERQAKQVEIQRLQDETLKVSLSSQASFDFDRSELKPAFYPTLGKLAVLLNNYDSTVLHVIGHTDSTGTDDYNDRLSLSRANEVSRYLRDQGVDINRLRTEGRGESVPRVPNTTASNRALNRRVEIYIKPVVEGAEERALESPISS